MYEIKITEARQAGYTDDQIAKHLATKSRLAPKIDKALKAGHKPADVLSHVMGMPERQFIELSTAAKHPNLYGLYGATWGTAKEVVPYLKYVDPDERQRFGELSQQKQTRALLLENLEAVAILGIAPIAKGSWALFAKQFPKTAARLSRIAKTKVWGKKPKPKQVVSPEPKPMPEAVRNEILFRKFEPIKKKVELPKKTTLRIQEQRQVVQKIIQEGLIDRDKPIFIDETQRAMYNIAESIRQYPEYAAEITARYKITPDELADALLDMGTHGGRTLNQYSQWARALKKAFPKDKAVQDKLNSIGKLSPDEATSLYRKTAELYKRVDNIRRMMMVGQLATAARNAISQAGRYSIQVFDDAIRGTMKAATGRPPREAYADFMADFTAITGRLTKKGRARLNDILAKNPESKAEMLSAPIHDIMLGNKLSKVVMFLNRSQEYLFRKMAFDAKLTSLCKKAGVNPVTGKISNKILNESVQHALEITYAAPGKSPAAKALLQLYDKVPFLTTIQPYPRFWLNALKFLWDFNPTGYLTAASRVRMFSKHPEKVYEALSKATVGTMMLGLAFEFRRSEYAGEKYYEIKYGDDPKTGKAKYIDTRAFAPISTYLYFAEQVLHPERITAQDRIQGLIGINRIGGTGLVLIDVLRSERASTATKMLKEFIGQYLGGFTVPARSIQDIIGQFNKEARTARATREQPITAPIRATIPVIARQLKPAPRLTRTGPYEREATLMRQLTGLTKKTKTLLEREIDRLPVRHIWPRTGEAKLDRLIVQGMGPIVERVLGGLVRSQKYIRANDEDKKDMLKDAFSTVRQVVRAQIHLPYLRAELRRKEGAAKKFEYFKKLVEKRRINQSEFLSLFKDQNNVLNKKQKMELIRIMERHISK